MSGFGFKKKKRRRKQKYNNKKQKTKKRVSSEIGNAGKPLIKWNLRDICITEFCFVFKDEQHHKGMMSPVCWRTVTFWVIQKQWQEQKRKFAKIRKKKEANKKMKTKTITKRNKQKKKEKGNKKNLKKKKRKKERRMKKGSLDNKK